jgi:DNA-binding transcriptional regulator GbsR (MarR family)
MDAPPGDLASPPNGRLEALKGDRKGHFKTSPEFWLSLQQAFDRRTAERTVGPAVRGIKPIGRGRAA